MPPLPYSPKDTPEFRLRVWPQSTITQRSRDSFGIYDTFNTVLNQSVDNDNADTEETAEQGLTQLGRHLLVGPLIRWVTFDKERTYYGIRQALEHPEGQTCAVLRPREVWLNSRVRGDVNVPRGIISADLCWWKPRKGNAWHTVRAQRDPRVSGIYHTAQTPNHDVRIETERPLPANQGFRLELEGLQVAEGQTTKARIRIAWGGLYSIVLRQDAAPTLERRKPGGPWTLWRELTVFGTPNLADRRTLRVYREVGRLIVSLDDVSTNVLLSEAVDTQPDSQELQSVDWRAATLALTFFGVSTRFELALLDWSYIEREDRGLDATFARRFERNGSGPLDPDSYVAPRGWQPGGSALATKLVSQPDPQAILEHRVGTQALYYLCSLMADELGRESPAVTSVLGYCRSLHDSRADQPLELSPALVSASESTAEPGVSSGGEMTCELSGLLLDRKFPGWRDVIHADAYNPAEFAVRWRLQNGTYTPWVVRLRGYIWKIAQQESVVNGEQVSLTLRDPILRLTQPAGIITGRYPPMGVLMMRDRKPLYTGDIIQEILRIELGSEEANRLNGNGDARRFLIDGHPPLVDPTGTDAGLWEVQVPTSEQMQIPPPYFKDAISWIKDLIKNDSGGNEGLGMFYHGFVTRGEGGGADASGGEDQIPCFIYGDNGPLLESRARWRMADAVYDIEDQDLLLGEMSTESQPEKDINTWIVANTTGNNKGLPVPALWMGTARLPEDDPRAPDNTWERINVSETQAVYAGPEWCESVAAGFVQDNMGLPFRMPRFSFPRAEPTMQWGDLVRIKTLRVQLGYEGGEFALQLDDWFRVTRLDHSYTNDGSDGPAFSASAVCAILSATEKAALGLD